MTHSSTTRRTARKAPGRKASKPKRANLTKATRGNQASAADLQKQLKRRTAELVEARAQQIATANVLKVISRSAFDLPSVLQTLVESAARLCGAEKAQILRPIDNQRFYAAASYGHTPEYNEYLSTLTFAPGREGVVGRVLLAGAPVQIADVLADPDYRLLETQRLGGFRTHLGVPLLREDNPVGILIVSRVTVRPFDDTQIELLTTFASQAVIAIENARLFNETREALARQDATAEILKIVASSPTDVEPVFKAIVRTIVRVMRCDRAFIMRCEGKSYYPVANALADGTFGSVDLTRAEPIDAAMNFPSRAIVARKTIYYPDRSQIELPEYERMISERYGVDSSLFLPLLRGEECIGLIALASKGKNTFDPGDIALAESFRDQAVIAIENARLFDEVQAKTRDLEESLQQQTATSEVLQVISSSPSDLAPVFDKMLENATRVCGAEFGSMNLVEGDTVRRAALYNAPPPLAAEARTNSVFNIHPQSSLANAIRDKQVVQVEDLRSGPGYLERNPGAVQLVELGGARTTVVVPMLRDDEVIGAITVFRQEVRPFSDKQIDLLTNFARQAVIAIENARLLGELRQRTDDLSKSLEDLRTAQGRLIQTEKLASLGQLTAGIAHEIKNPLNFVNNFSSLSAELVDELDETLVPAPLDQKMRGDVNELTQMLKSNLEKVVQHGKRADSIVKNMLQHSRDGSGEYRSADINTIVEDSLNLAYHGARAEKSGFTITLQHDLDPRAGAAELYPQEITRALLNLISNGFYAATRRKADSGDGFEPVLSASTKDRGPTVEIRIRDNGAGIPPEVREKMFNPFFTTKPTGEGTGLGLSMTHDIIVKQHGGKIDVETESGTFTEFIITLPRGKGNAGVLKSE
jgi:signal transduction histidine kinase